MILAAVPSIADADVPHAPPRLSVPAGTHLLRVENAALGLFWEQTVELPAGEGTTIRVERSPN